MASVDPKHVEAVFDQARRLSDAERRAFLDAACAGDAALRAEVDSLLRHFEGNTGFLDEPAFPHGNADSVVSAPMPQRVGPYRLLERVGQGGMGTVYLAEQTEPVRRRVALKVIKRGMDTDQVIARFEAERQALAIMDHPNIARVLDAGATSDGRPYFVMELVTGVPITEHCDRRRLDTRQRVELFLTVCEAVQHAHQKGIIHRDIKPTNVLVAEIDGKPVVKVIDFGVAKALQQPLTERTLFTETGQLVGTPEYMAPEQADPTGLNVDTRADIYSLGVLLYEVLVSALPFDPKTLRSAGFAEIQRIIREVEPPRPSTRLSRLEGESGTKAADLRRTDADALGRQLKGDLDWITMKALEKDRARRYASAAALAEDLERHLQHEPVLAGPPGAGYRARKFVRRNRTLVVAGTAVALALVSGIIGTTWQAIVATRQRERALLAEDAATRRLNEAVEARRAEERQRAEADAQREEAQREARLAQAVNDFLREDVLAVADPRRGSNPNITVREALDNAAGGIEGRFADEPATEAMITHSIGATYRALGLYDDAEPLLARALELFQQTLGEEHWRTLDAQDDLAETYESAAKYDLAEPLFLRTLQIKKRVMGEHDPDTMISMNNLATFYLERGRFEEAEPLLVPALQLMREHWGDEHLNTAVTMASLARLYISTDREADGALWTERSYDALVVAVGEDHPYTLTLAANLANIQRKRGDYDAAEASYRSLIETLRRTHGPDHPRTTGVMGGLALLYTESGAFEKAEAVFEELIATVLDRFGPDHPNSLVPRLNYALMLTEMGREVEAEPIYRDVLERSVRVRGETHVQTILARDHLAAVLSRLGRDEESLEQRRIVRDQYVELFGPDHVRSRRAMRKLANKLVDVGRTDEARTQLDELLAILRAAPEPDAEAIADVTKAIERLSDADRP